MDFYENLNKGIQQFVPLAARLEEVKRGRNLEAMLKLIDMGDTENAGRLAASSGIDVAPESFTQSPRARLQGAQTDEALRSLEAKRNIATDIQKLMQPREEDVPFDPYGGTTRVTTPGGVTPEQYRDVLMKHDPTSAATLKSEALQTGTANLLEKLKMQYEHNKALEELKSRGLDIAAIRANRGPVERPPKVTATIGTNPVTGNDEYLMTDGSFSGVQPGKKPSNKKGLRDLLSPSGTTPGEKKPLTAFEK